MTEPPRRRLGAAYADEVRPEHVGRRVSLRHLVDEDGRERPTDVVGVLLGWDDGVLRVQRRDGSTAMVPAARLVASRLVPDVPPRRRRG